MVFTFNSGDTSTPPEVFNKKLFLVVLVATCGSIIFGYDLAFIGGVFSLPSFIDRFDLASQNASAVQAHMVNSFQGGAFFGVMVVYFVNERWGRRFALLWASVIFNVGVILCMACRGSIPVFYVGRIISVAWGWVPRHLPSRSIYPSVLPRWREVELSVFEIGTQIGTITGFWINYGVQQTVSAISSISRPWLTKVMGEIDSQGDKQWFIPIAFQFIPAGLMAVGLIFLSESPRWLYAKHRTTEAATALTWLRQLPGDHPYLLKELSDYQRQMELEADLAPTDNLWAIIKETFSPRMLPRVIHGCLLMILQNSTGINAMNNFSVSFFNVLGFHGTLLSTGLYGIVKGVAATITFLFLIDRFGRRPLLFVGSVMCAFSMYYVAAFSSITDSFHTSQGPNSASYSAVAFIYIFGAGYVCIFSSPVVSSKANPTQSVGWNIPWIIAAEIFPTRIRSFCLVLTTCSHWLGEFYTSYAVTYMFASITYGTFIFFGTMTVIGGIYVYLLVPETKGVALEDMDYLFGGKGLALQQMRRFREHQRETEVIEGRCGTPTEVELKEKELSLS
ncbi:hypothetical protein N7492_007485 [Penicillium capsulatum]|uniref:Major facilitator superfamily (MFS) profile domain-containing protein n=1 Tax=Penicillium capsulatum TaxID=69766 RepID=A0A9W9LLV6_9EURO|nr:hypothetical protein N7492_007485 [Penicillium capsulatum]